MFLPLSLSLSLSLVYKNEYVSISSYQKHDLVRVSRIRCRPGVETGMQVTEFVRYGRIDWRNVWIYYVILPIILR